MDTDTGAREERCMETQGPQTQKEGGQVKMEAEIGVTLPQAKECPVSPEAGRGKKGISPRGFGGYMALPTP